MSGARLVEAAERFAVDGGNSATREWLVKIGRALVARDGATAALDWRTRVQAVRKGFLPPSYVLYGLPANRRRDYVSDFEHWTGTWRQAFARVLNGEVTNLFRDKLAFHFMCLQLGVPTPELLGVIMRGSPHLLEGRAGPATWAELRSLVDRRGRLVVRPATGQLGRDVLIVSRAGRSYRANAGEADWPTLEAALRSLDYFVLSGWIEQAAYSSAIFPHTTNTVRLLTVRRRRGEAAVLAAAIHRFGREKSMPVDNFARGGLSVAIDPTTGTLGRGASQPDTGQLAWYSRHPDTGAPIEGVRIPGWDRMRESILGIANLLSLPYMGWDVVVTEDSDGWTLLEANHNAGLKSIQVHGPLLGDTELRAFFREHDEFGLSRTASVPRGPMPSRGSAQREWLLRLIRSLSESGNVDWRTRVRAARHGFLPSSYLLYDIANKAPGDYVTDAQRWARTARQMYTGALNGEGANLLRDKLAFHFMARELETPVAELVSVILNGRPHRASGGRIGWAELRSVLERRGGLVVKPATGQHGRDVLALHSSEGTYRLNGEVCEWPAVQQTLAGLDYFLVCELVQQAPYAAAVFPDTTNTLRFLTVRRRGRGATSLAAAIHCFGRPAAIPVDNFSQGGLSVAIDAATGTLGRGVSCPGASELVWHSRHPDTGAAIEGVRIPGWEQIRDGVLGVAHTLSFLPYVGWDVVVTDDHGGFTILEGNSSPDLDLMQVHQPLLQDPEVRAFYQQEGVIRRWP